MEEAYGQAQAIGVRFDHVVCVCGSGGTTAGVALGTKLYSPGTRALGIAVDNEPFDTIVPGSWGRPWNCWRAIWR